MEVVSGIGGLFFRARAPGGAGQLVPGAPGHRDRAHQPGRPGVATAGRSYLFAPFAESTDYFGAAADRWMINLRVRSLEAMVAQLRGAGIAVQIDPTDYPHGRFARLYDPEGNPIELWEAR